MIPLIGWIGSALFAFCSLPQAIKIYKTRQTSDLSWVFLGMWFLGEVLSFFYVILTSPLIPILCNYGFNFVILCYIIIAKFIYDKREVPIEKEH